MSAPSEDRQLLIGALRAWLERLESGGSIDAPPALAELLQTQDQAFYRQVAELTLSGVGTLTGEAANDAVATLLDHATLKSADMSAKKQTLTATLTNGLKLQLGVSGDTVSACGGWSCPEFFEAFESGL